MQKLAHTRHAAEQYSDLRGLSSLPLGLLCLELFLFGVGWLVLPGVFVLYSIGITIVLTIVAVFFYRLAYGHTRPLHRVQRRDALFAVVMGILLAITLILDPWIQPRVSLTELVLAAGLVLYYWPHRRFAAHYLVIAAVIACVGLLPLFGGHPDPGLFSCAANGCTIQMRFGSSLNLASQSVSAGLMRFLLSYALLGIVGGLCDHLFLRRTLNPTQREVQ